MANRQGDIAGESIIYMDEAINTTTNIATAFAGGC